MTKYLNRPFSPSSSICFGDYHVPYYNDDHPAWGYYTNDLVFVAQPLYGPDINKQHNAVPVPLMMTDEWEILRKNEDLLEDLRQSKKIYDYVFIGQCNYAGREVFRSLELDSYHFKETKPIYDLQPTEKAARLVDFLKTIAQARFVFAPRGIGSSSFRAYQAMMAGSVPIITGMNDYPFSDIVDWDKICIRGELSNIHDLIRESANINYNDYRSSAISFWDEYCAYEKLYDKLRLITESYQSHDSDNWSVGVD